MAGASASRQPLRTPKPTRKRGRGKPFTKGKSPNPGGVPKAPELIEIRRLFRMEGPDAVERICVLAGLRIKEGKEPAKSEAVQAVCLREILDRGYGRAVVADDEGKDAARRTIIEYRWADAPAVALESPPITLDAEPTEEADVVWKDAAD